MKNIRELFKSKKYLRRIFLWITVTVMFSVILFSMVSYFNAERIFRQNEYEFNRKIFSQVEFNIKSMDSTIRSLCTYLFYNNDITSIMYKKDEFTDMADLVVKINTLTGSVMSSNQYIDSMCIYNNYQDRFFYIGESAFFDDVKLNETLNSYKNVPLLKPISRKIEKDINSKRETRNVFTYFMYDSTDKDNHMDGAVIMNIKNKWLLDNIKTINMIDTGKGDSIYILDDKQEFIEDENRNQDENLKNLLKKYYLEYKAKDSQGKESGFFERSIDGERFFITYMNVENIGFTILKIQPCAEVYKYVNALKTSVIIITLIFLLFASILSVTVSRGIYKPVSNLLNDIVSANEPRGKKNDYKDEISYLGGIYKQSLDMIDAFGKERNHYKNIMKTYWLKKILTESHSMDEAGIGEISRENNITVFSGGDFMVCILKIDNYRDFQENYDEKDREIIRFAIINIYSEMLSGKFAVEGIDMKDDHIVLLVGLERSVSNHYETVEEILKQTLPFLKDNFNITVTASVSEKTNNFKNISKLYSAVLDNAAYRFVLGKMSIITQEKVKNNIENERADYSKSLESKLAECIKSGNITDFENSLQELFSQISKYNNNNIIISLIRLTDTLKRAVDELAKSAVEPIETNFTAITRKLFEVETMEEYYDLLDSSVKQILEKKVDKEPDERNSIIVDTVKDIIQKHYYDSALCQDQIASMIRISSRRLSRIFKDSTHLSILEYINEVRLNKAAEWLVKSELNVHEVINKTGFENETYFYSIFKKKFGTTPREYALKQNLKFT